VKKPLLVCALSLLAAAPAAAQINLAWRNCISVTTGSLSALANINYACDGSAPSPYRFVVSFIAPPNVTQFVGVEFDVEISTANPILPDFWRHGVGECRDGSYNAPGPFAGIGNTTTCQNPFSGSNTLAGFFYTSGSPTAGKATSHHMEARDTPLSLTGGQQYLAQVITLDTFRDVDTGFGVCPGCQVPACITVTRLDVQQVFPNPAFTLINADVRKSVTWQGGTPGCAGATPARNHTWGAIKTSYR
jgi:hypothetical protein